MPTDELPESAQHCPHGVPLFCGRCHDERLEAARRLADTRHTRLSHRRILLEQLERHVLEARVPLVLPPDRYDVSPF
jgi:hypothetical protein